MKRLLVRFLMKNSSHILDVVMTETEAKDILSRWKGPNIKQLTGYDKELDHHWIVCVDEIAVIFTMDFDKMLEEKRRVEYQQAAAKGYSRPQEQPPLYPPFQGQQGWSPN